MAKATSTNDQPDTRVESYLKKFKVAAALAIIRSKPQGMTGQEYAEQLCNDYIRKQNNWKKKNEMLQGEVLRLKQELVKVKLTSENSEDTEMEEASSQPLFLTPPSSSEPEDKHITLYENTVKQHTEFLRHVVSLKSMEKASPGDQHELSHTIKDTIFQCLDTIQSQFIQDSSSDSPPVILSMPVLQYSLFSIANVVNLPAVEVMLESIQRKVLEFVKVLCLHVLRQDKVNQDCDQRATCKLLLTLSKSISLKGHILHAITIQIKNFSEHLKDICKNETSLDVTQCENISYLLELLENILEKQLEGDETSALLPEMLRNTQEILEASLLHISKRFPLFAHYVWRISGMLQVLHN